MSDARETAEVLDAPVAEAANDAVAEEAAAVIESATAGVDEVAVEEIVVDDVTVDEVVVDGVVIDEVVASEVVVDELIVDGAVVDEAVVSEVEVDEILVDGVVVDEQVTELEVVPVETPVAESSESAATDGSGKRVVRTLAVGQEVQGTVKRISEFGAFVDIGVGRDGLVHISELSVKRVGKVTDVITEGQQIQVWIKKLDRERNRISLTLIPPGTVTIRDLNKDDIVTGTVTRILPYGAFVDIGVGRDALLHVREMGERYIAKPEEVVKVGEQIEAKIIEIQRRRGRIDLSIKGLRPEPEVEAPVVEESSAPAQGKGGKAEVAAEPGVEALPDAFAEVEVLSPFQLALQRAQERSGVELEYQSGKGSGKSNRKEKQRREQEDIFERTLKTR